MIERYHLDLAALALLGGVVVAVVTARVALLRPRAIAIAGVVAAALGSSQTDRGPWWLLAALALCLPADDESRPHPLGDFTVALTVVALVGVWAAVPDTEPPLAGVFALAPLSVVCGVARRTPGLVGTAALVVALAGAVWNGSAGWGSALATAGVAGLVATAPVLLGFGEIDGRRRVALVAVQAVVGLLLPRAVMSLEVGLAVGAVLLANVALGAVALSLRPLGSA